MRNPRFEPTIRLRTNTEKVEALHGQIHSLFTESKGRVRGFRNDFQARFFVVTNPHPPRVVTLEDNRSRQERRAIATRPVTPEQLGLAGAQQLAQVQRTRS